MCLWPLLMKLLVFAYLFFGFVGFVPYSIVCPLSGRKGVIHVPVCIVPALDLTYYFVDLLQCLFGISDRIYFPVCQSPYIWICTRGCICMVLCLSQLFCVHVPV